MENNENSSTNFSNNRVFPAPPIERPPLPPTNEQIRNDISPHKKKRKKLVIILLIIFILVIGVGVGAYFVITYMQQQQAEEEQKKQEEETIKALENCQNEKVASASSLKEVYQQQIYCYSTYRVSESDEKIEMFSSYLDETTGTVDRTCLENAMKLIPTEAEINSAYGNTVLMTNLMTKTVLSYDAQIKCYEAVAGDNYSSEIADLKAKKAEGENLIISMGSSIPDYTNTVQPNNYNPPAVIIENVTPVTPSLSCDDYHTQYYRIYMNEKNIIMNQFNSSLTDASTECAGRGASFSGCYSLAERRLESERDVKLTQLKNTYSNNMLAVGCEPQF